MGLTSAEWHARFLQQAYWTRPLREHLYKQSGLTNAQRVLEVGCGTGAILGDLRMHTNGAVFGLDIDFKYLEFCRATAGEVNLACMDAHHLAYPTNSFDLSLCHFLLLWVTDPAATLTEMKRVTRDNGHILCLAEPDYGGRIDYPNALAQLGQWQSDALRDQGADPHMGRKLAALFTNAGLAEVEFGVIGGQWQRAAQAEALEAEWHVLRSDLAKGVEEAELSKLEEIDKQASQRGERVLYVPTFYAWGRVPSKN